MLKHWPQTGVQIRLYTKRSTQLIPTKLLVYPKKTCHLIVPKFGTATSHSFSATRSCSRVFLAAAMTASAEVGTRGPPVSWSLYNFV